MNRYSHTTPFLYRDPSDESTPPAAVQRPILLARDVRNDFIVRRDLVCLNALPDAPQSIPTPFICTVFDPRGHSILRSHVHGVIDAHGFLFILWQYRSPATRVEDKNRDIFALFIIHARLRVPLAPEKMIEDKDDEYFTINGVRIARNRSMDWVGESSNSVFCERLSQCASLKVQDVEGYRLHIEYNEHPSGPFTPITS